VSKDSNAEKLGIRKGDTIERLNGEYISTTVEVHSNIKKEYIYISFFIFVCDTMLLAFVTCQLEKMLLDISRDHFHQAEVLNGKINIQVSYLYVLTIEYLNLC
jgi:hypothetical protein